MRMRGLPKSSGSMMDLVTDKIVHPNKWFDDNDKCMNRIFCCPVLDGTLHHRHQNTK